MPIFYCEQHGAFGAGSKLCGCLRRQLKEELSNLAEEDYCPKCGGLTAKAGSYHHDDEWCLKEEVSDETE